ncbi:hypothetical protein JTB14_021003 [Gonioctena quinquepunctata]|nr:hypothetical protein JTB14_021003 [Gonioctena quinquepunctata]
MECGMTVSPRASVQFKYLYAVIFNLLQKDGVPWSREQARLQKLRQECLEDDGEPKSDFEDQEDYEEEDNLERQDLYSDTEQEISDPEVTDEDARGR